MSKSDEYVWNWIPDLKTLGLAHGDWGCPICGKRIFEGRGHYPWLWHPDRPYKVECPECHRRFPTNDYHQWMLAGRKERLNTKKPYVDDGNGYVGPDGVRYQFIQYALGVESSKGCVWSMTMDRGIPGLAARYASTGDQAYARRCALIMARIATQYPSLNPERSKDLTLEQIKRLPYRYPPRRRAATIGGYHAEGEWLPKVFGAYRSLYPFLEKGGDAELRELLAAKIPATEHDVKSLIEWNLCHEMLLSGLEGNFIHPFGMGLQKELVNAALCWDMHDPAKGVTTEYIIEWVLRSGPISAESELHNSFDRDGFGSPGGLDYNFGGGLRYFVPFAETVKAAGVDLYDRPRFLELIKAPTKTIVAGKWSPSIGDGGIWTGGNTTDYWDPRYMGPAVEACGDPLLARALANSGKSLGEYKVRVDELIAEFGKEMTWESRNYPAFGLAMLESGEGDYRRGVSCYYGGTTAHGHFDRLTFEVFNKRGPVTPDLGHPGYINPKRDGWGNNTVSHNTVTVDASKQLNREPGYLEMFAVTPTVQALRVSGEFAYRGIVSRFNRTLVYVDTDEKNSYLVDIFRVVGGSQHDYSLHGAGGDVSVDGLDLVAQEGGTVAGPDVGYEEYYDGPPLDYGYEGSGFQYMFNVEKGSPKGGFTATWDHHGERTPFLRVHVPAGQAEQVLFADGLPAFAKKEDGIRFMLLRNGRCPPHNRQYQDGKRVFPVGKLASTFVTVLEPLYDGPFITGVERVTDAEGLSDADVALAVARSDGATDLLVCLDRPGEVEARGMTLAGDIGLRTTVGGAAPSRLVLLGGTSLASGQSSLRSGGLMAGTVATVDYDTMMVTVPEELPAGDELVGRTIVFDIPPHTTSFVMDSVQTVPGGSRIKLRALDAIAYRSEVEKIDSKTATITLSSRLNTRHAGTALAGMRLYNEDRSVGVKIAGFKNRGYSSHPWPPFGGTASVEKAHDLEQAFVDRDGDGKVMAYVYEFGPGDRYRITATAHLEREQHRRDAR